jgi:molecular chaperone DnaK (HSP70)
VTAGYEARAVQADDPANTIVSVKRFMGRGVADVAKYGALPYRFVDAPGMVAIETAAGRRSPVQVSAEILRVLRERAERASAASSRARWSPCPPISTRRSARRRRTPRGSRASTCCGS